jgi:hypothetical protein
MTPNTRGLQRPPAALLVEVEGRDARDVLRQPLRHCPGAVGAGVVGDGDTEAERRLALEVLVQAEHVAAEVRLFVVHGEDDVDDDDGRRDVRRRRGARRRLCEWRRRLGGRMLGVPARVRRVDFGASYERRVRHTRHYSQRV